VRSSRRARPHVPDAHAWCGVTTGTASVPVEQAARCRARRTTRAVCGPLPPLPGGAHRPESETVSGVAVVGRTCGGIDAERGAELARCDLRVTAWAPGQAESRSRGEWSLMQARRRTTEARACDVVPGSAGRRRGKHDFIEAVEEQEDASDGASGKEEKLRWRFFHLFPVSRRNTRTGARRGGGHAVQVELARRLYLDDGTLPPNANFGVDPRAWCQELVVRLGGPRANTLNKRGAPQRLRRLVMAKSDSRAKRKLKSATRLRIDIKTNRWTACEEQRRRERTGLPELRRFRTLK